MFHSSNDKAVRCLIELLPSVVLFYLLPACGGCGLGTPPPEPVKAGPFANINSDGDGGYDIYVAKRATTADAWGQPQKLGPNVNSSENDKGPTLYSSSNRKARGTNYYDIWVSKRPVKMIRVVSLC